MKGSKGAFHSMKGQTGRSALLKLTGGNSALNHLSKEALSATIMWPSLAPNCHLFTAPHLLHSLCLRILHTQLVSILACSCALHASLQSKISHAAHFKVMSSFM